MISHLKGGFPRHRSSGGSALQGERNKQTNKPPKGHTNERTRDNDGGLGRDCSPAPAQGRQRAPRPARPTAPHFLAAVMPDVTIDGLSNIAPLELTAIERLSSTPTVLSPRTPRPSQMLSPRPSPRPSQGPSSTPVSPRSPRRPPQIFWEQLRALPRIHVECLFGSIPQHSHGALTWDENAQPPCLLDEIESPRTPFDRAYWEAEVAGLAAAHTQGSQLWRKVSLVAKACRVISRK